MGVVVVDIGVIGGFVCNSRSLVSNIAIMVIWRGGKVYLLFPDERTTQILVCTLTHFPSPTLPPPRWSAQIAHQGQLAHHVGKRQATGWPAGVSPAACPNYPFCNVAPVVPLGYTNTAGYPAGVSAAACPGYPYC